MCNGVSLVKQLFAGLEVWSTAGGHILLFVGLEVWASTGGHVLLLVGLEVWDHWKTCSTVC